MVGADKDGDNEDNKDDKDHKDNNDSNDDDNEKLDSSVRMRRPQAISGARFAHPSVDSASESVAG